MINYAINNGDFEVLNNKNLSFNFKGALVDSFDISTNQKSVQSQYGDVLFEDFKEGDISFDITFESTFYDTRAGVILNYTNKDNELTFYQIGIKSHVCRYAVDYYNGKMWEFKAFGGTGAPIQSNVKYSIHLKLRGSKILLIINSIKVLEYTNLSNNTAGVCGLYVCNGAPAKIENIQINTKRPKVFCVMKFEQDFDELYQDVIKPQCEKMGLSVNRADEFYTATPIIQDITREISESSIIVCDITMDNPNVFYELGYAHALQKSTILLADREKREKLPFDVSGYRTIFYSNRISGKKQIEESLCKYIENIMETNDF